MRTSVKKIAQVEFMGIFSLRYGVYWFTRTKHKLSFIFFPQNSHYHQASQNYFVSLKLECQSGVQTRDLRFSKQAALTTAPAYHYDILIQIGGTP